MGLILYAIPFFLACIALELVVAYRLKRSVYHLHDAVTSLNIGFVSETLRTIVKILSVFVYIAVLDKVAAFTWDISHPAVWVLAFFMYDFFYYWAHRCGHEINLLWASHVVHHSSEEFNLSTAFRQSWTNQIFYWIFYLPMAIVGIPVQVFVVTALISAVYQFWSHTRLVPKLGWPDRVFVTPSNHRCHHGRNPYCIDKNYGGILIIWDRMFGTYTEEKDDEPVVYGTLKPLQSWNPVWGNFKNFVELFRQAFGMAGWRNKLMTLFAPPGWQPEGAPALAPANDTVGLAKRFETATQSWHAAYGIAASSAILIMVLDLLLSTSTLTWPQRIGYTVMIVLSTACIGRVFEGAARALQLELVRGALVGLAVLVGVWWHPMKPLLMGLLVLTSIAATVMLAKGYTQRPAKSVAGQGSAS